MKHLSITTCSVLSSISIGGFHTIRYVLWLLAFLEMDDIPNNINDDG